MCSLHGIPTKRKVSRRNAILAYKVFISGSPYDNSSTLKPLYGYHHPKMYVRRTDYKAIAYAKGGGFYAFRTLENARSAAKYWSGGYYKTRVLPVRMWGKIRVYDNGYRSQYLRLGKEKPK